MTVPQCVLSRARRPQAVLSRAKRQMPPPFVPQHVVPYEDHCVVKYSTWPQNGTAVTNEGTLGKTYNGALGVNEYGLAASGATYNSFTNTTDYISVATHAALDNPTAATWEFLVYPTTTGITTGRLFDKAQTAAAGVAILFTGTQVRIIRYQDVSHSYTWDTSVGTVAFNNLYFIQISWDMSTISNAPEVSITNSKVSVTATVSSATAWDGSDSAIIPYIMNRTGGDRYAQGNLYLFRYHTVALTSAQKQQNFYADWWRAAK